MTNFEMGECSPVEFRSGIKDRVKEYELDVGSRYTWMLALSGGPYKLPTRIENRFLYDETSGIYLIENTLLGQDGQDVNGSGPTLYRDGFYMRRAPDNQSGVVDLFFEFEEGQEGEEGRILTGYFRDDYDNPSPRPVEETFAEAELPLAEEMPEQAETRELVAA